MGAPLILSKNRNSSPEHLNPPPPAEEPTQTEISVHEEDNAVNGKLDIHIKDNSIYEKPDSNTTHYTRQTSDLKHNYH